MSYYIIRDDGDYGGDLISGACPSIKDAESIIVNNCRPGYIYHICEKVKMVRFKFTPELEEVK